MPALSKIALGELVALLFIGCLAYMYIMCIYKYIYIYLLYLYICKHAIHYAPFFFRLITIPYQMSPIARWKVTSTYSCKIVHRSCLTCLLFTVCVEKTSNFGNCISPVRLDYHFLLQGCNRKSGKKSR